MSEFLERISKLSPQRLALLAVQLNSTLEQLKQQAVEPLAIVGLACRFPGGATDPEAYWRNLAAGRDVIREVPADRWDIDAFYDADPETPGKMCTRWGGFLDRVDQFDPEFFGISPREAAGMDPQQRLLLEVAWEALEHAGQNPERLAGSRTGVFTGLCTGDYFSMRLAGGPGSIDAYVATGNAHSVAAGRISYVLGLQGPCLAVDTACSSSLVAVHLACQSLRLRECDLALTGGVNLILAPDTTITLSKSHMMSPVGRCKAFDVAADGFVRSEGCGLLVLKRLSDARQAGDRVLAVIRGSACNQDGASSGLTAPNGPSQVAVIRDALANAGLQPSDVEYVEAHGTGTTLGDPIEARALAEVFAPQRPHDAPLRVGSVKSNMGHAESAAGIAGLIKAVLALQHGKIPASLHFNQLNPHIDWAGMPITVPTALVDWNRAPGQRVAGVSSFGFGGTNAHIIVADAPDESPAGDDAPGASAAPALHLLPLSARTPAALTALAQSYATLLAGKTDGDLPAICRTAGAGRAHFEHRLAVRAANIADFQAALAAHGRGASDSRLRLGSTGNAPVPGVVFLFTGQGSQYPDMGRELYETQPVFRQELERCAAILAPLLDRPLLEILYGEPGAAPGAPVTARRLDQTQYTQPALFALEYALAALWRSWGIEPAVVLGHSVGEYVAACVAGIFSLEDGLRLIAERGRLMAQLPAGGVMATVFVDHIRVAAAIGARSDRVAIACLNGPANVVISGADVAVHEVLRQLEQEGIKHRLLQVSHAFHSPLMDPVLAGFEVVAQSIAYSPPEIAIVSNLTGAIAEPGLMTNAGYWRRHVREAVRFADSVRALTQAGQSILLEIGPHPVLTGLARQTATAPELTWASSLARQRSDWDALLESASILYARGANFDWNGLPVAQAPRTVALPTYPFQRDRFWLDPIAPPSRRPARPAEAHPLLGDRLDSPAISGTVFALELGTDRPSFLDDHRIFGRLILPSPAYIEMALAGQAALQRLSRTDSLPCEIADLSIREPLFLPENNGESCAIQLLLEPEDDNGTAFRVCSRDATDAPPGWRTHVSGRLRTSATPPRDLRWSRTEAMRHCPQETSAQEFYDSLIGLGLEFGERFRGISRLWRGPHQAIGEMALPQQLLNDAAPYRIHPALLDACFHLLGAALPANAPAQAFLLIGIDRFNLRRLPPPHFWNHTVLRSAADGRTEAFSGDIWLYDDEGDLLAEITGLQLRRATGEALERAGGAGPDGWFYELNWRAQDPVDSTSVAPENTVADFVPALAELAPAVGKELLALAAREKAAVYDELIPALEALSAKFILRAFARLGWSPQAGEHVTAAALAQRLAIVPGHRRLFSRLLAILAEDGWLQRNGEGWVVARPLQNSPADLGAAARDLGQHSAAGQAEVALTARCADRLDEVLRGTCDPLHLLFPNGNFDLADALYRESPVARTLNIAARHALLGALASAPSDRTVRILEIGAGTGGTSSFLIPELPPGRTRYTFTDVSPLFVARAQEEFGTKPFLEYTVLDIEKPPATQGFARRTFDVIVAANVLHATRDLRETVAHAASLLTPGGLMILLEGTAPRRWVDLTFGLTDGWWRFTDATLRPDYALLPAPQWLQVLGELGLEAVHLTGSTNPKAAVAHQALLLARKPLPVANAVPAATATGHWIILSDESGVGAATARRLQQQGEDAVLVPRDGRDAQELAQRFAGIRAANTTPWRGIINLWPLDVRLRDDLTAAGWAEAQDALGAAVLHSTQAFLATSVSETGPTAPRLWLATRGAQVVATSLPAAAAAIEPLQAVAWGLARTISLEHPAQFGAVIDLDRGCEPETAAAALVRELQGTALEDAVAFRGENRFVPRVMRTVEPPAAHRVQLRRDASYLITGGLGGLGLSAARMLALRGAGHIVLLTRRSFPARATWSTLAVDDPWRATVLEFLAIEKSGATIVVARGDVADETAMAELFSRFGGDLPPLRGVLHAAVEMSSSPIATMTAETFSAMGRAKARGGWVLHRLTQSRELDFLVFYSSTTAVWGVAGLGHYAAANQALDLLAARRRAAGLPALSINWGTWQEMRVASDEDKKRFAQSGLRPMAPDRALVAMERLLGGERSSAIVAGIDWNTLRAVYEVRRTRPIFANVTTTPRADARAKPATPATAATGPDLVTRLQAAAPARRRDLLATHLRTLAGAVLGFDAKREIPLDQGLFDMGMDSLMSVELKGRLERSLNVPLPSTLTFNYPTLGALCDFLLSEALSFGAPEPEAAVSAESTAPAPVATTPQETAAERDEMSEEDLEQVLLKRLEKLR